MSDTYDGWAARLADEQEQLLDHAKRLRDEARGYLEQTRERLEIETADLAAHEQRVSDLGAAVATYRAIDANEKKRQADADGVL